MSVISGAANFVRSMNYAFRVSLRLRSLSELSMMLDHVHESFFLALFSTFLAWYSIRCSG